MTEPGLSDYTLLMRADAAVWTQNGQQLFFFDTRQGMYYGTEAVGTRLWELLAEPQTPAELYRLLAAEYELEPELWRRDGITFLEEAVSVGILEKRTPVRGEDGLVP
ncbi:PqqD family protein [Acanthopleuribacter pedis]|uniref:PqqD family protein n=1 Tax=Acanthopleuribacter pedis TaxID=442870 RepID=A0A8J7Q8B2_9BACT|nr:PqqD family protein [Acanthopleuribacter pedis]MBO1320296.1 PqqD family protein [Acanthopleuribacter pedis]